MLEPIETWTRKSLQFQPPLTQPFGVSCQPLLNRTTKTISPTANARYQASRVVPEGGDDARRGSAGGAAPASDGGCGRRPSVATARRTALTMIDSRPKPADPRDDVDEVGRDVGAGHDRRADRARRPAGPGPPAGRRPSPGRRRGSARPGRSRSAAAPRRRRADADGGRIARSDERRRPPSLTRRGRTGTCSAASGVTGSAPPMRAGGSTAGR